MSSLSDNTSPHDREHLLEVTKQISRDQNAYDKLNEDINHEIIHDIFYGENTGDPKEDLLRAGHTIGFLEEARYQALKTDKEDPSWYGSRTSLLGHRT